LPEKNNGFFLMDARENIQRGCRSRIIERDLLEELETTLKRAQNENFIIKLKNNTKFFFSRLPLDTGTRNLHLIIISNSSFICTPRFLGSWNNVPKISK
jgi:hypothetical protein